MAVAQIVPVDGKNLLHWYRKGVRLHDQPSLCAGLEECTTFRCIYVIDPGFRPQSNDSINKWRFLLETLTDVDKSLRSLNSRLFVVRERPTVIFPRLFKEWKITHLSFEEDPEFYGRRRDEQIQQLCRESNVEVICRPSHTLYDIAYIFEQNDGKTPLTFNEFFGLITKLGLPPKPVAEITDATKIGAYTPVTATHDVDFGIPSLQSLGFRKPFPSNNKWLGGETEALRRLHLYLEQEEFLLTTDDEKAGLLKATVTDLGPYLRFGCLSARLLYTKMLNTQRRIKNDLSDSDAVITIPKVLLWREYFYCLSCRNENFDKMSANKICLQIPWNANSEALAKWTAGKTGFPWIDAIQTQVRQEGWIHEAARRATISFFTRGTLWLSWEKGMKVFEELLMDADLSLNAGTWMWLSCSSFFHQSVKVYCPVKFGRKMDPHGHYIRKYVPILKSYPLRYIHEPWTAPRAVQVSANCIIGKDYPLPMIDHTEASKINFAKMRQLHSKLMATNPD